MRWLWTILFVSLSMLGAGSARAQSVCAQFEIVGSSVSTSYNPFSSQDASATFAIKVTRLASNYSTVRFLLVDTTGTAVKPKLGSAGPDVYNISWLTNTTRQVFASSAETLNANNGASVSFTGGSQNSVQTTNFQLTIPRGQAAVAGTNIENLTVRYQCSNGGNQSAINDQTSGSMSVRATVPQFAAAYIAGAGQSRGVLDFGTLDATTGNVRRALNVTALSTLPYTVTIASANGAKLKRAASETQGVGFTMAYGGAPVLNGGSVTCPITPAPSGRVDEFAVTLDGSTVKALPAGSYADTITLTFRPLDGQIVTACR